MVIPNNFIYLQKASSFLRRKIVQMICFVVHHKENRMKKNLFFFSVLCLIAFTLVGCSSEDDTLCSNDTSAKMEFISLGDIPSLSDISEGNSNVDVYMEALTRIIDFGGSQMTLKYKSAESAMVSQNLYDDVMALYSQYSASKRLSTRGTGNSAQADCVACTISNIWAELMQSSEAKDKKKEEVWDYICSKYGDQGVPYDKDGFNIQSLLLRYFEYAIKLDSLDKDFLYRYNEDIEQGVQPVAYIAIVKISETEYHSVTVLRSKGGVFFCRDDQNNKRSVYLSNDIVASFYVSRPKLYNK